MSLTSGSLAKIEEQKEYSNVHKTRPIKVELWHILNKGVITGAILPFLCYYTVLVTYIKECV